MKSENIQVVVNKYSMNSGNSELFKSDSNEP